MHPADIKAAVKKNFSSIAAMARELGITPQCVGLVIAGQSRSRRIEQHVSQVTGLALSQLWPRLYEPTAHAEPPLDGRTPTSEGDCSGSADLTRALLGDLKVLVSIQMGDLSSAPSMRKHALRALAAIRLSDNDWLRLLGQARLMALIPSLEPREGDSEGSR